MEDKVMEMCMPIPQNAIKVNNYLDAKGEVLGRIIELEKPTDSGNLFIAQDKHSSLGFTTYESAEKFLFNVM